ncbi:hypothetical protein DL766_003179 [Monosporascus sp. MC13-8B]|uniref:BTB domain-containing protein n=1 Tax=Monosporascus cannonballus TaxID=155416 RepID=A0ABY0HFT0_9PEZI|nr:hypothetical protein DL762_002080 [Monosporascus cannonballus]RYO92153.1 hypothetical protein DL763_004768 [Monosporascus cannonballus]RYP33993.1 hypothetical protein DL766_003179 [Monosporascus sp. MC13-8B]
MAGKKTLLKLGDHQYSDRRDFSAHADLLGHFSKYFRAALNSPMEESRTLQFELAEPATRLSISFFVDWIYATSSRAYHWRQWQTQEVCTEDGLLEAWLLAEYLRVSEMQNDILRLIHTLVVLKTWTEQPALPARVLTTDAILPHTGLHLKFSTMCARIVFRRGVSLEDRERFLIPLDSGGRLAVLRSLSGWLAELKKRRLYELAQQDHFEWFRLAPDTPGEAHDWEVDLGNFMEEIEPKAWIWVPRLRL